MILGLMWLLISSKINQINSAVIIDFNLSFQEYQDSFPDSKNVVPQLKALHMFWPKSGMEAMNREVMEFMVSECNLAWCHQADCVFDPYYNKDSNLLNVDNGIKEILESYEPSKIFETRGLDDFKRFMEENELIKLLPGVVPGFALRNHKWGKTFHDPGK